MRQEPKQRTIATLLALALAFGASAAAADEAKRSRLQGAARLGRGHPVIGATVTVTPEDGAPRIYLTSTDRRGAFRLDDLLQGDYRVEIRREGLQPVVKERVAVKFPFRAVVEVPMTPGPAAAAEPASSPSRPPAADLRDGVGSLAATVVDLDGNPVTEVDVRLAPAGGGADPRLLRTDENGKIETAGLPAGRWSLEARALGYLPLRAEFVLNGPLELRLVVVPQPGDYEPSPLDLVPPEAPIPPAALSSRGRG